MNLSGDPPTPGRINLIEAIGMLLASALLPSLALAQDNFEIQVYGAETVAPGTTMVELHSNVAARGTTGTENGVHPTQGAFHEMLEITQGLDLLAGNGFYVFTSIQPDSTWEWVGDHVSPRIRAPESWHLPVGLSLSTEFGYQRREFSTDTWTLEVQPIIDKQWGPWYASFNPVLGRALRGENGRYTWQKQFFENGAAAFAKEASAEQRDLERQVEALRQRLTQKDRVIAKVTEEFVKTKKELGEL